MSRFRRRLMGLAAMRKAFADDFVRVEYIENTSNAYIDTNIQFNLSMEINGKFQNMDNTTSERDRRYFGGATTWRGYGLSVSENTIILNEALSGDDGIKTYNVSTPFEIHYKNKSVTVNNYTVNLNTTKGNSTEVPTIYLLAEHRPNTAAILFLIGRLYYFKIYNENDVLVRDYIPMYQISTDTYGLWDRVEKKFYVSPNGTKFVGGREIIYDAEIEYLQSNGTQWINTNFILNDANYEIDTKFNISTGTSVNYAAIFTNRQNNYLNTYGFALEKTRTFINPCNHPNYGVRINYSTNTDYTLSLKRGSFTLNGTTYTQTNYASSYSNETMWIFRQRYNNENISAKLYYLTIKHNNKIVMDLIPVRVGNVGYMYDKVSGELFGNDGSGSFILGQDTVVYDKI